MYLMQQSAINLSEKVESNFLNVFGKRVRRCLLNIFFPCYKNSFQFVLCCLMSKQCALHALPQSMTCTV